MQGSQESEKVQTMSLVNIVHRAIDQLKILANLDVSKVIGVSRTEDGWLLAVEIIERKAIPDTQDLLGTYEVHIDNNGELTEYERTDIRRRMDLVESAE